MAPKHHVRIQPDDGSVSIGEQAVADLQQLGFRPASLIREALQDGASASRAVATPAHPATYPGTRMWAETSASLAILGRHLGWEPEGFRGVDLVVNHRHAQAVIVTAGNGATGDERYVPQVRYERTDVISGVINGSIETLWDSQRGPEDWTVWFLLHNLMSGDPVVPAELSLPARVLPDGMVATWTKRIIIPRFDHQDEVAEREEPLTPTVRVLRRSS
jgi:hypothetical protein